MGLVQGWKAVPRPRRMGGCVRPVRPKGFYGRICGEGPGGPYGKDRLAVDERKQTGIDWKILKNQGVTEEDLKKYGVWKMIRTGNEKLDPKTLLPVAAAQPYGGYHGGLGRTLRGAGLEGGELTVVAEGLEPADNRTRGGRGHLVKSAPRAFVMEIRHPVEPGKTDI